MAASSPSVDATKEPVQFAFVVRDDTAFAAFINEQTAQLKLNPKWANPNPYKYGREIYRMTIPRDEWNNMVLQLQPSYNGDGRTGQIALWYNGKLMFTYQGDWGYAPNAASPVMQYFATPLNTTADELSRIGVYVDIYRSPYQTGTQTILFSNVKYATTFSEL